MKVEVCKAGDFPHGGKSFQLVRKPGCSACEQRDLEMVAQLGPEWAFRQEKPDWPKPPDAK